MSSKEYFRQYDRRNREQRSAYRKSYYQKNKEVLKAKSRAYKEKSQEKIKQQYRENFQSVRNRRFQVKYGMTYDELLVVLAGQNYTCAIQGCGRKIGPQEVGLARAHFDHNHATGKPRQFLCGGCNTALGMLEENIERIAGLITYLCRHENKEIGESQ